MKYVINFLIDFSIIFVVLFVIQLIYDYKKRKNYSKLKKNDEVKIFMARYNLDIKKTNYKVLLLVINIINSFIISFTATLILNIKNYFWKISVSFVVIFILIYALFEIAGRLFKRVEEKKNV